jgi:hypothetical protein
MLSLNFSHNVLTQYRIYFCKCCISRKTRVQAMQDVEQKKKEQKTNRYLRETVK